MNLKFGETTIIVLCVKIDESLLLGYRRRRGYLS
jgi:hypothetical protein